MSVKGQFRDLDDPDAFVWFRSFETMEARLEALASFYSGSVWKEYGQAANATMLNSDNVLLLRSTGGVQPFAHNLQRNQEAERAETGGIVVTNICALAPGTEDDFARFFSEHALPVIQAAGARIDGAFVTERSANSFPRLPVREGETVFVWLECHKDEESAAGYRDRLRQNASWIDDVYPRMDGQCWRRIEVARLTPTSRSLCAW